MKLPLTIEGDKGEIGDADGDCVALIFAGDDARETFVKSVNFHDRLVEQLKALEWADDSHTIGLGEDQTAPGCPCCQGIQPDSGWEHCFIESAIGHKETCDLNTLLKELEG